MIDVFFSFPDKEIFDRFYDFISSSEFKGYASVAGESLINFYLCEFKKNFYNGISK